MNDEGHWGNTWNEVEIDGRTVSYVRTGRGQPLVLLHGFTLGHSTLTYGPSIEPLAEHFDVIVPDLPGYGSSTPLPEPYSTENYITFLERFLNALSLEQIALVGFSKGGGISLGFALQHPERVSRLVLVSSYALSGAVHVPLLPYLALRTPGLAKVVWRSLRSVRGLLPLYLKNLVFGDSSNVTDELVKEIREPLSKAGSERAFMTWLRGEMGPLQLKTNYAARLPELHVPTLLIHGTKDLVVPAKRAKQAAERIPNVDLELYKAVVIGFRASHLKGLSPYSAPSCYLDPSLPSLTIAYTKAMSNSRHREMNVNEIAIPLIVAPLLRKYHHRKCVLNDVLFNEGVTDQMIPAKSIILIMSLLVCVLLTESLSN